MLLMGKVKDEVAHILDFNETCCIWIVLHPGLSELITSLLADSSLLLLRRHELTFQDDSYEQVQEDDANDENEANEVGVCDNCATAIDTIFLSIFKRLRVFALEKHISLSCTVIHDLVPAFTSGDSE